MGSSSQTMLIRLSRLSDHLMKQWESPLELLSGKKHYINSTQKDNVQQQYSNNHASVAHLCGKGCRYFYSFLIVPNAVCLTFYPSHHNFPDLRKSIFMIHKRYLC